MESFLSSSSVLSRIKLLIQDEDDVLEKEDLHVLAKLKMFLGSDDVKPVPGANQCLASIERVVSIQLHPSNT
jgi:hypothetical protein